ncbi:nucleolin 1-like [Raphanus sativus]|uniref:Nucleolin 1 n=1 Tax=Raphanus sativus TaxID=3726 RepID=A0A6J0M3N1_RAPSA|nr:nucleolin 1 [Raphanus sativus]KAJ4917539.1 nucleolin 1-like [Raphanus sativus]
MGKKSATKGEAAPAAIKATKPLKKGKREPEDDLDTKVNLKKQKKDLVAAVQKEKAEKKVPKKVESSDEESDSEEEDKEPAQKKAVASTNGTVAKKAKDESSSGEESSDEEEVAVTKKPAAAKPAVKDSSSSEEDDSEDESEDEKPVAKKAAPVATKAASSDSSEEDSDEESEDEKPAPKETKAAKKDGSSDGSDSDESESEEEEETPKKKSSDVEMVDAEKQQPKTPSTPATGGSKTLFVANLPFQVEKSDVEEFFKGAGQVVDVRFAMSKDDGSFRGFGHVEFASAGEAQKALEFHGRPLLGRELRLDVAQERGERPAYNTPRSGNGGGGGGSEVFVKGFDSSLPVNDIKSALSEHFASCGEITRVSVPVDRETGGSRGIAYLEFKEGTEKAFELNGSEMGGWNLVVDEPRPKENNSGGFNSGRSNYGGGRDSGRGRGRGRGRDNFRGRGRGRENGRGRPSFTHSEGKKTTFSDE